DRVAERRPVAGGEAEADEAARRRDDPRGSREQRDARGPFMSSVHGLDGGTVSTAPKGVRPACSGCRTPLAAACWHPPKSTGSPGRVGWSRRPTVSSHIKEAREMATILAGTDTSAAADLAVEGAARLAHDRGAELLVLYVEKEG